jgi:hypothetical protein
LRRTGLPIPAYPDSPALLAGDPAAVPVLSELLKSPEPRARLMGAAGLRQIGRWAQSAVPALIEVAQNANEDAKVRGLARMAVFFIDPVAAHRAGLLRPPSPLALPPPPWVDWPYRLPPDCRARPVHLSRGRKSPEPAPPTPRGLWES